MQIPNNKSPSRQDGKESVGPKKNNDGTTGQTSGKNLKAKNKK
jgi:hypothetical protein